MSWGQRIQSPIAAPVSSCNSKARILFNGLNDGEAKQVITPAVGVGLSGLIARFGPSNGIGDPLFVQAELSDGTGIAAIVQTDLPGFGRWHVAAVREYATTRLGIPREHVLLSAAHTHSGPGWSRSGAVRMAPYSN